MDTEKPKEKRSLEVILKEMGPLLSSVELCDDQTGSRIVSRRQELKLSQGSIVFPGCIAAHLSRIEHNLRRPSFSKLLVLALMLGTTPWWLARGVSASNGHDTDGWWSFPLQCFPEREQREVFLKLQVELEEAIDERLAAGGNHGNATTRSY